MLVAISVIHLVVLSSISTVATSCSVCSCAFVMSCDKIIMFLLSHISLVVSLVCSLVCTLGFGLSCTLVVSRNKIIVVILLMIILFSYISLVVGLVCSLVCTLGFGLSCTLVVSCNDRCLEACYNLISFVVGLGTLREFKVSTRRLQLQFVGKGDSPWHLQKGRQFHQQHLAPCSVHCPQHLLLLCDVLQPRRNQIQRAEKC